MKSEPRSTLKQFAETSTVKGLAKFMKAKSVFLRCLWIATVIFGGAYAVYLSALLVSGYLSYEVATSVSFSYDDSSRTFPDISICFLNPVKEVHVEDRGFMEFATLMRDAYTNKDVYIDSIDTDKLDERASRAALRDVTGQAAYFQSIQLTAPEITDILRNMIPFCLAYSKSSSIIANACDVDLVGPFSSDGLHECATFRFSEKIRPEVEGIALILYLNNFVNFTFSGLTMPPFGSSASGIRLLVHEENTQPSMADGINISPGRETVAKLHTHKFTRLGEPYGKCSKESTLKTSNNAKYTRAQCIEEMLRKNVEESCNCIPSHLGITDLPNDKGNITVSDKTYCVKAVQEHRTLSNDSSAGYLTTFKTSEESLKSAMSMTYCAYMNSTMGNVSDIVERQKPGGCLPACEETVYRMEVSSAPWPNNNYKLPVYNTLISKSASARHFPDLKMAADKYKTSGNEADLLATMRANTQIEENFISLEIKFADEMTHLSEDKPISTWESLLGGLGGTLNLWIGISFVTCVEVVELMYKLVFCEESSTNPRKVADVKQAHKWPAQYQSQVNKRDSVPTITDIDVS